MKVSSIVSSSHLRVFLIFTCLVVGSDESDDGSRPDDRKLSPFLRGMAEQLRIGLPKNNANVGSRLKQIEAKTKRKSSQHNNFLKKMTELFYVFILGVPKASFFSKDLMCLATSEHYTPPRDQWVQLQTIGLGWRLEVAFKNKCTTEEVHRKLIEYFHFRAFYLLCF